MIKNTIDQLFTSVVKKLIHKKSHPIIFSNSATGVHATGNLTCKAAQVIEEKYVFCKFTPDGLQIERAGKSEVDPSTPTQRAIGVLTDNASAAGELVNVQLLGAQRGTCKVLTAEKIQAGDLLLSNEVGKACSFTTADKGAHYVYGISIANAEKSTLVEFIPTPGVEKTKN